MDIIRYKQAYDPDTGEPTIERDGVEKRCDWSGEPWSQGNDRPHARYDLRYGCQDPCFGAGGVEYEFGQDFCVDMHTFLGGVKPGNEYAFKWSYTQEAMQSFDPDHPSDEFADYLRTCRVRAARDLLESDDSDVEPYHLPGFTFAMPDEFDTREGWEEAWAGVQDKHDF